MITIAGEVVDQSGEMSLVRLDRQGCLSCRHPCGASSLVLVPFQSSGAVAVTLSGANQLALLLHTLIFPLLGFLAGAVVAGLYTDSDPATFAGALVGLGLGARLCRTQSFARFDIREAVEK